MHEVDSPQNGFSDYTAAVNEMVKKLVGVAL
jgi:hypothetical protein